MNLLSSTLIRVAALAFALPILGFSAAISVNSVCIGPGNCGNPANHTDSVTEGNPISGSASHSFAVGSDSYLFTATYSASYNGSSEQTQFSPIVTYTGAGLSTKTDVVTINFFQDIYDPTPGPFSASTQTENVPLSVGARGTASGDIVFDNTPLGKFGPYGPGTYNFTKTDPFGAHNGVYLSYQYHFVFDFGIGTSPGTVISSAEMSSINPSTMPEILTSSDPVAPEPSQTIPVTLSMLGFAYVAFRKRREKLPLSIMKGDI